MRRDAGRPPKFPLRGPPRADYRSERDERNKERPNFRIPPLRQGHNGIPPLCGRVPKRNQRAWDSTSPQKTGIVSPRVPRLEDADSASAGTPSPISASWFRCASADSWGGGGCRSMGGGRGKADCRTPTRNQHGVNDG